MKHLIFFLWLIVILFANLAYGDGMIQGPNGTYYYHEYDNGPNQLPAPPDYMKSFREGQQQAYQEQLLQLERERLLIEQGYRAYGCKIIKKVWFDKNLTVWIRPDGYYITESGYEYNPTVRNLVNSVTRLGQ